MELSYDGTNYHGWQIQNNARTVQQNLNEALSTILRTEIKTMGSGRTDTGVHAYHQVAHFDYEGNLDEGTCHRLNSLLSKSIAIKALRKVQPDVSARFDAVNRAYVYLMHTQKDPFKEGKSYRFARALDLNAMKECCEVFKSWQDFKCFSKVHTEVNNFNCEIFDAKWESVNDELKFYVSANRFLRGMVRSVVGTMLLVGENKIGLSEFKKILESKDRKQAGSSAPAHGLYLSEVNYPKGIYL